VTSSRNASAWSERCRTSLDRSRDRRETTRRERRRRIRLRGGGLSVAGVALLIAVVGAGAAVGQSAVSGGKAGAGAGLLTTGSKGAAVTAVQRALGIPSSGVTGVFDARTEANVRLFQRRNHLLVDGIVGPQTRAALGLVAPSQAQGGTSAGSAAGAAQKGVARQGAVQQGAVQQGGATPSGLQGIAQCESGGNPRAVGGGGQYRGKYQFTRETWRAVGGSGDPAAAPEAEQDQRAATLYQRSGTSSWPVCGR
jgi:peptidoglycan hydrolase-like protein with peptidoglycan-binding domain